MLEDHQINIKKNYKLKIKTIIKRGDKVETILKLLNNKRHKIKNLILGLALEGNDTNKIINSLTGSYRKKLNLPITIVLIQIIIMFLKVEETPNPNTLKFIPEKSLDFKGTRLFNKEDDFQDSDLLKEIFLLAVLTVFY